MNALPDSKGRASQRSRSSVEPGTGLRERRFRKPEVGGFESSRDHPPSHRAGPQGAFFISANAGRRRKPIRLSANRYLKIPILQPLLVGLVAYVETIKGQSPEDARLQ
jgi:hypothetical protein